MIYNLKNKNYYTFRKFEENKLPPRAYFIPFSSREKALRATPFTARYESDLVACLSGKWDFRFYKIPTDLEDEFDSDSLKFDEINVPSVWQYTGYAPPIYMNDFYPFPCIPPFIPKEKELGVYRIAPDRLKKIDGTGEYNSVGVYRKFFTVNDLSKTHVISFLGVISSLDLFVNGRYVGYSEGAHNTAEFLLDGFLVEGKNELIAVVHRWSNGTYLECQDMIRNNGIFRDVLLYETEKEHINDYEIETVYTDDGKYDLNIRVFLSLPARKTLTLSFLGESVDLPCDGKTEITHTFKGLDVQEWSAEIPTLYDLTISLNDEEHIAHRVGFTRVEIQDQTYLINGKNVKLFGVNHHDTHPTNGYVMTIEEMDEDLSLMKKYNVNAVRTSHYPPDPAFLELAAIRGLYVVDEADIETHGVVEAFDFNLISNRPWWKKHYFDRVKRMYFRDRNCPAIVMWSLGNESGGIVCQNHCYRFLRKVSDLPVQYEGAFRTLRLAFDVVSYMYSPIERMKKHNRLRKFDIRRRKPYFLCEYAHAMGTGPGALEEYVELFLSDDLYVGGCIWEWADHAIYHPENGNFTYGGDHNEYRHDGTFCVDGLFRSDRQPYTSAELMKVAYRPVRARYENGKIRFTNVNRFLGSDYLKVETTLSVDGTPISSKELDLSLSPTESVSLPVDFPEGEDAFLTIRYTDKRSGDLVATEQVALNEKLPTVPSGEQTAMTVSVADNKASFLFDNGLSIRFDTFKGVMEEYSIDGKNILNEKKVNRHGLSSYTEIYRAPFDNDMRYKKAWHKLGYNVYKIGEVTSSIRDIEKGKELTFAYPLVAKRTLALVVDKYSVYADGRIKVETCFTPKKLKNLPRMGKIFELKKEFDKTYYYGRGEESYPDMTAHAPIGLYRKEGNFGIKTPVPQQSGERVDSRFAEITDENGLGVRITATEKAFGLNVNHYTEERLSSWNHIIDYSDEDATIVAVDGFIRGSGSGSCGPGPEKRYKIPDGPLRFSFYLTPLTGKEKD